MNLKKFLISKRSQAIVEYILIFVILAAGIVFVFGGWNPEKLGLVGVFNQAVDRAVNQINQP